MKRACVTLLLCIAGMSLAGCSMRNYLEKDTPTETLNARQDLTMPPDLRLPPPGTTAAAPDTSAAIASNQGELTAPPAGAPVYVPPKGTKTASAATAPAAGTAAAAKVAAAPANAADQVYINAGISVTNPDGSRKTAAQLNRELQDYYIAQKKAKNPNYGSVFNMGNIFKDE